MVQHSPNNNGCCLLLLFLCCLSLFLCVFPAQAASSAASASSSGSSTPRAVFDAPPEPENIYANPPSLMSTLQDKLQPDIQDPALRCVCVAELHAQAG